MSNYRDTYAGKTVLVTGGAGAIGSNLTRELVQLGARVLVLDDLSSGQRWNVPSCQGVLFAEGDILDEVKLKRVFFERPQIVYHLAAFFANQNSLDHPEQRSPGQWHGNAAFVGVLVVEQCGEIRVRLFRLCGVRR